jgi:hypothetical protein
MPAAIRCRIVVPSPSLILGFEDSGGRGAYQALFRPLDDATPATIPLAWRSRSRSELVHLVVSKGGADCARSPIRVLAGPCLALTLARLWQ